MIFVHYNKWYHNGYGKPLRELLLEEFEIEGIIEYPHFVFFSSWTIATSILIARKVTSVNQQHKVKFIRSETDPRGVDLNVLADALHGYKSWPLDWTCQTKLQFELQAKDGWKTYFSKGLNNDFRKLDWPTLKNLFSHFRRGSLDKEEGGVGILGYPFHRKQFGPRRETMPPPRRSFQTRKGKTLTASENRKLEALADQLPAEFRGNTLRNADNPEHYELQLPDVMKEQTLEPPILRDHYALFLNDRAPWTQYHDEALAEMRRQPEVNAFISEIESVVNLTENVLPKENLWNVLREPLAGELIIPRKLRGGHRVHINPFAFDLNQHQVRISSNLISYSGCLALDPETGLDHATAVRLIAAFLISSFGQLQFETEGYNREGCLSVEERNLERIHIFDPRWVQPDKREAILNAFSRLPYPILTNRLSSAQPERNHLDYLFAQRSLDDVRDLTEKYCSTRYTQH